MKTNNIRHTHPLRPRTGTWTAMNIKSDYPLPSLYYRPTHFPFASLPTTRHCLNKTCITSDISTTYKNYQKYQNRRHFLLFQYIRTILKCGKGKILDMGEHRKPQSSSSRVKLVGVIIFINTYWFRDLMLYKLSHIAILIFLRLKSLRCINSLDFIVMSS